MSLEHVLHESALLDEALLTHVADMRQISSVLLHVVEHRVLPSLGYSAVRAHELTLLVLMVDEFGSGHRTRRVTRRRRRFNFWLRRR